MARARLTTHFAAHEFDCHDGTPWPARYRGDLVELCRVLERLREVYGPVTVTSGYRHRQYNRKVGGAPLSYHVWDLRTPGEGVAADVRCASGRPRDWMGTLEAILARRKPGTGGLHAYPAGWVHVDLRARKARW